MDSLRKNWHSANDSTEGRSCQIASTFSVNLSHFLQSTQVTSTLARQSVSQINQITSLGPPGVPKVVAVLFRQFEAVNCSVLEELFI